MSRATGSGLLSAASPTASRTVFSNKRSFAFVRNPGEMHAAPYAALFLRLVIAVFFATHLYRKFFAVSQGGFPGWWGALTHHYPAFVPIYVLTAEFSCAILLPLGFRTRFVALYAIPSMIGVVQFWWAIGGFWFTNPGAEFAIMWLCLLILQAILGDGAYALKLQFARSAPKAFP